MAQVKDGLRKCVLSSWGIELASYIQISRGYQRNPLHPPQRPDFVFA